MVNMKLLTVVIVTFLVVVVGTALLDPLSDSVKATDSTNTQTNQTIAISSGAGEVTPIELGLYTVTFFGNGTNSTVGATPSWVVDVNVNWTEDGDITVGTDRIVDGNYNISYGYYPYEYVQNSTSRTLLGLLTLFFVLGIVILVFVVAKGGLDEIRF